MPNSSDHARAVKSGYVTDEGYDPRSRFGLYRLCDCPTCDGKGKEPLTLDFARSVVRQAHRCSDCRGEGRLRQEVASCESPEAVGVALVTLARESEWLTEDGQPCAFGLLDRMPECETCEGHGRTYGQTKSYRPVADIGCSDCKGSGVKPTGTWLILPWLPSPRNVRDAAKLMRAQQSHTPS